MTSDSSPLNSSSPVKRYFMAKGEDADLIPIDWQPYWRDPLSNPQPKVSLSTFAPLNVAIKILKDQFIECTTSDTETKYSVIKTLVILTNEKEIFKLGLQTFPTVRIDSHLETLSIYIKGSVKIAVDLPRTISSKILKYLIEGKPPGSSRFTCFQFIDYINDLYIDDFVRLENYSRTPWTADEVLTGNSVILYHEEKHIHAALYLGHDLYLWHCGPVCLRVSSFKEMLVCYPSTLVEIAIPKVLSS